MILRGQEQRGRLTPQELAQSLLDQRAVLQQARNRRRELRDSIAACEATYGVSSAELPDKLATGEIQETADVCDWLLSLDLLKRLESD